MRVLVTGGAGYIGSVVTRMLLDEGHGVVVLDNLSRGHADAVPAAAVLVAGELSNVAEVLAQHPVDAVMHLAARSLVGESVLQPDAYWATNVDGTRGLLEAMRANGVTRLVVSSSAATYGAAMADFITETTAADPTSPYGATKLAADDLLAANAADYGVTAISLRYFNVAGAAYGLSERHEPETHLIPNVLSAAAGTAATVTMYGDDYPTADGTCVRDYVHVLDIARAHLLAMTTDRQAGHHIFNLGSGLGYSVREVIDTVERVTARTVPVTLAGRRAGDPARLVASNERAAAELGWAPTRNLDIMVRDAWAAHASNGGSKR